MAREPSPSITDADVRSLAAKLKGLHTLLTPAEQALLHTVLGRAADRAASSGDETAGFAWAVSFNPFPYLDAIAAEKADARAASFGDTTRPAVRSTRRRAASQFPVNSERSRS